MKRLPARVSRRQIHENPRDATLRLLKLRGHLSVGDLCKSLNLTHTAVRRCLSRLQQEGLVEFRSEQPKQGRPLHRYHLTNKAASCFPTAYEAFVNDLLDTVFEQHGHPGVMEFLKANNDRVIARMLPQLQGVELKDRVAIVAEYFARLGYMTQWVKLPDNKFFLFHQNCAIRNLAERYRQLCVVEPRLIEALLGVKISREQYILKDQPVCGYLIDPSRSLV